MGHEESKQVNMLVRLLVCYMSQRLNELEKEIIIVLSNRIRGRWKDIKADVRDEFKNKYDGSGFDVVFSRSLKRLEAKGIIFKHKYSGLKRPGYMITGKGGVLALKIKHGLGVQDVLRDELLSFGLILQRLRDDSIIMSEGDLVSDYFKCFKELVMELDLETFIEELKVYERIIDSNEDSLNLSSLMIK
jgi:hypothetical protein